MFVGFESIPPTDALGISASLLATVARVSVPRSSTSKLAAAAATAIAGLVADAQVSHDNLSVALSARDGAVLQRSGEVRDALQAERIADRMVSALLGRLDALSKQGVRGAEEIKGYLYPDGLHALNRLTGRPQRARYEQWIGTWLSRPHQGSPADLDIAVALSDVRAAVARFAEALDAKDGVSRDADGAIDARRDAFTAWVAAIEELAAAVRAVQWSEEAMFLDWLSPYTEWKQAQEARTARSEAKRADGGRKGKVKGQKASPEEAKEPGAQLSVEPEATAK